MRIRYLLLYYSMILSVPHSTILYSRHWFIFQQCLATGTFIGPEFSDNRRASEKLSQIYIKISETRGKQISLGKHRIKMELTTTK